MADLPEIEFGGIIIKPQNGVYKCPYGCGDPRYPKPKWKTAEGFRRHLKNCSHSPEKIAERDALLEQRKAERVAVAKDKLAELGIEIGDEVIYVREFITKPTHDSRGRKVRYEPEKEFSAAKETVRAIDFNGCLIINGVCVTELFNTIEAANERARERKTAWDEHVAFSSFCR